MFDTNCECGHAIESPNCECGHAIESHQAPLVDGAKFHCTECDCESLTLVGDFVSRPAASCIIKGLVDVE